MALALLRDAFIKARLSAGFFVYKAKQFSYQPKYKAEHKNFGFLVLRLKI